MLASLLANAQETASDGQRKTSAKVFFGATIVGFDETNDGLTVHRNSSIMIVDDTIEAIFNGEYEGKIPTDTEFIDATNDIITPGFIDTHRHGWQTAFKTLGSNTTLAEYFKRYGEFAAAGGYTKEQVFISQLAGIYEALNAGVTTMLDHAHHIWSNETVEAGLKASIESGARIFWCYAFHNISSFTFGDQVSKFKEIARSETFKGTAANLGIAFDGFHPGSQNQAETVASLSKEFNVSVLTTHSLQGIWGVSNSPRDLHALGILNTTLPVVFSHASFLNAENAQLLRSTNQYISITAESEMHYGHDHTHSHLIQDQASLGVDTHFTYSTDIITQARLWLQNARLTLYRRAIGDWKVPANNPMSVNQAFLLATRNGGLALKRPDLGIIAEGAKADLVIWDGRSPGMLGWDDPVAAIILHSNVGDIKHVLVDGQFKKRDGRLTISDYDSVQERFLETARAIQTEWKQKAYPVLEGQYPLSDYQYERVPHADTLRGVGDGYGKVFFSGLGRTCKSFGKSRFAEHFGMMWKHRDLV